MPKGPSVDQQACLPCAVKWRVRSCPGTVYKTGKAIICFFLECDTETQGQTEDLTTKAISLIKNKCRANNLHKMPFFTEHKHFDYYKP